VVITGGEETNDSRALEDLSASYIIVHLNTM
jgi:hypothetical protein